MRTDSLTVTDRIRREAWLARFGFAMRDYPARPYRQIARDLRREVTADAGECGMRAALRDLGRPASLADRHLAELGRPRPRWLDGALAAGVLVFFIPALCLIAYGAGAADTLASRGGGAARLSFLGTALHVVSDSDGLAFEGTMSVAALVAFALTFAALFATAARVWRLWAAR